MRVTTARTRLGQILRDRGMSITALARELGITPVYASLLVHGMVGPSARAKWATRLAEVLHVDPDDLFEEVGTVRQQREIGQKSEGQEMRPPAPLT